jgi:glycosyltransferase involved in cell wall biosynthesis
MGEPLVSCVVPVFNGERFLGETLRSVLDQTYRPIEVLVVDDGSTDGTAAVIAAHGDRVTAIRQANRGEAAARNAGWRAARGDLVAFLDADDLWEPEKTARQVARLRSTPEIDLCFTRFQNFWVPELEEEARRYRDHPLARPSAAWSVGTLLAPRRVFERFGPFDETLGWPNITWFLRAAGQGARIEVLSEVLMRRRLHGGNANRAKRERRGDLLLPVLKAWRDYRRAGRGA